MQCPHCGREFEADEQVDRDVIIARWNSLAQAHGLRFVHRITHSRLKSFKKRLQERPDFWEAVGCAIGGRGAWARNRKVPTFDQAISPSFLQKLLEGNYDAKPGEVEEDERTILILALQGRRVGDTVATKEGLEGSRGVELWEAISLKRLQIMSGVSRGKTR